MPRKKDTGPGLISILFAAVLSILIGMLLAAGNLAILPVSVVKKLPPKEKGEMAKGNKKGKKGEKYNPKTVYYIAGSKQGSRQWKAKKAALEKQIGTITLTEGELNAWAKAVFKVQTKKGKKEEEPPPLEFQITPAPPNFRIAEDKFQLSSELDIPFFQEKKIIYQAQGNFVKEGGQYVFKPESSYLGSCPIPPQGGLGDQLFKFIASSFTASTEYEKLSASWYQLTEVKVEDGTLKLVNP